MQCPFLLTTADCDYIKETFVELGKFAPGEVGSKDTTKGAQGVNPKQRKCQVIMISHDDENYPELAHWWQQSEQYQKIIEAVNHYRSRFNIKIDMDPITQFTVYNPGDYFVEHRDSFVSPPYWVNWQKGYTQRKLSASIELSAPEDYEGGWLKIEQYIDPEDGNEIKMGRTKARTLQLQGQGLFFPSYVLHEVTPVTSGQRFSLVMWFHGPWWE